MRQLTKFQLSVLISLILLIGLAFSLGTQLGGSNSTSSTNKLKKFSWLEPQVDLEDFASYSQILEKKARFFQSLAPLVVYENHRLTWRREQLLIAKQLIEQELEDELTATDIKLLTKITAAYSTQWPLSLEKLNQLLIKVQPLPEDLVLIQAANESAWGTSRFAKQANNLFGQWCFSQGCGLVPLQRNTGQKHEVRKFSSPLASVQSYMHNLNTHLAYKNLRKTRNKLAAEGKPVTGAKLAPSLLNYSERGQAYVDELLAMLKQNKKLIDEAVNLVELQPIKTSK